jgi:hypothetical protein
MPRALPATAARLWNLPPLSPLHSGPSPLRMPCPVGVPHFGESRRGGILLRWLSESHCQPRHVIATCSVVHARVRARCAWLLSYIARAWPGRWPLGQAG